MNQKPEFADRYQALGIPYPEPNTMCKGRCEGVGYYPENDKNNPLWIKAHNQSHNLKHILKSMWKVKKLWFWKSCIEDILTGKYKKCDGWHFIKCTDCNGTGKAIS